MEGQNSQILEAHPVIVKVSLEITDNPFRRQARIQLSSKSVNDEL
jgi:hypothetical protein